jgi:glycosyltransferase involved in cell wall biosynthesis
VRRGDPDPAAPRFPAGLRVVHIIAALGPGGAERQVEQLVLRSADDRVSVVCVYGGGLVAESLRAAGIEVSVLGIHGWGKLLAPLRLIRLLRQAGPDVVNVHLLAGQLWGIPAARLAGVRVVVSTEHSLMDDSIEGRPLRLWLRVVYRLLTALSSHTVAVSATGLRRLRAWGVADSRMSVIDNAVDLTGAAFSAERRRAVRRELGVEASTVVIGAVGRLERVKRFHVLIEAAAPLLRPGGACLVVVGQGSEHEALVATAERLGVGAGVRLLGARADVLAVLDAFDVFASPSLDETFGIAVLEAVANGLPTLYGQCPALEDLGSTAGTRVSAGADEVGAWTRALRTAMVDVSRRAVPPELRGRYDAECVAAAYRSLYVGLLAATGRDQGRSWPGRRRPQTLAARPR